MGTYYMAVDFELNMKIEPPKNFANKIPALYAPDNPFAGMVIMMNSRGDNFEIINDADSQNVFYCNEFKDITEEVYAEYQKIWGKET